MSCRLNSSRSIGRKVQLSKRSGADNSKAAEKELATPKLDDINLSMPKQMDVKNSFRNMKRESRMVSVDVKNLKHAS